MTQDEIIEMAKQAGYVGVENGHPALERFAKLVAEKIRKETLEEMIYAHPTTAIKQAVEYEREACAKVCEDDFGNGALNLADAIRARGQA